MFVPLAGGSRVFTPAGSLPGARGDRVIHWSPTRRWGPRWGGSLGHPLANRRRGQTGSSTGRPPYWLKGRAMAPTPLRIPPTKTPACVRAHTQTLRATAPRASVMTMRSRSCRGARSPLGTPVRTGKGLHSINIHRNICTDNAPVPDPSTGVSSLPFAVSGQSGYT